MKYEEWIKYEELRKKYPDLQVWEMLDPELLQQQLSDAAAIKKEEKSRGLSAILQVFNPRRI